MIIALLIIIGLGVLVCFGLYWIFVPPFSGLGEGAVCSKDSECDISLVCNQVCSRPCDRDYPCGGKGECVRGACWGFQFGGSCSRDHPALCTGDNACAYNLYPANVQVAGCCQPATYQGEESPYCKKDDWPAWGSSCDPPTPSYCNLGLLRGTCEPHLYSRNTKRVGCCQSSTHEGADSQYCRATPWTRTDL